MTRLALALLLLTCSATPSWAAGLTLSVRDGLVSLDAQDVTVRQILTEWARVGKTRIVNVERITGGPITLKLDAVPEKQALDIILRSIPGYMAMPRSTQVADASLYDRILIMPTTTAVAALRPQQPGPAFTGHARWPRREPDATATRRSRRPYHRAWCSIRRIQLIRWMTRRWLLPPLPASFPCLRSTRDPRRRWFLRHILGQRRNLHRPLLELECRPTRGTRRSERRSRVSLRQRQSNRRPLDGVCARRSPIDRALLAIQFNRRPPATRHAHNNARN